MVVVVAVDFVVVHFCFYNNYILPWITHRSTATFDQLWSVPSLSLRDKTPGWVTK